MAHVYALYHVETKSYILDSGYYGNSSSIYCFPTKRDCERHIEAYYRHTGFRPKRFKIKETPHA